MPTMRNSVFAGMSMRRAIEFAYRSGCSVRKPRRTGEWLIRHHRFSKPVRVNARRKDAPRSLVALLASIQESQEYAVVEGSLL